MFAKLAGIEAKFEQLEKELSNPDIYSDQEKFKRVSKAHAEIKEVVDVYREHQRLSQELEDNRELAKDDDPEIRAMAEEEVRMINEKLPELEEELKILLLPKDPLDEKNTILEIRAGTGGEEAALFAADLFRMYMRFAETRGWRTETMHSHETDSGGYKEVAVLIQGDSVYSWLKYEAGTHRVQRVPATESQGRIHTSAVTVAVLPEAEEVDVDIKPDEIRVDVFRSSGPGGQSVNTTDSAVRITHLPSGIVVSCQDEKSQIKNRVKAMKVLRSRILQMEEDKRQEEEAANRREQVGTGDRSGRIRTYNYPQGRVTDHRINLTLYRLETFMEGDLEEMIRALATHYQTEALRAQADAA